MFPLRGGNPPPAPQGRGHGVSDHRVAVAEVAKLAKILSIVLCILLHIFSGGVFYPPYNPPRSPAHSAGPTQKARRAGFCDFQKTIASAERAEKKLCGQDLGSKMPFSKSCSPLQQEAHFRFSTLFISIQVSSVRFLIDTWAFQNSHSRP